MFLYIHVYVWDSPFWYSVWHLIEAWNGLACSLSPAFSCFKCGFALVITLTWKLAFYVVSLAR